MARPCLFAGGLMSGLQLLVGPATIISEIGLLTHPTFIAVSEASVQHLARRNGPVAANTYLRFERVMM